MDKPVKIRRFREKHEREMRSLIAHAGVIIQLYAEGDADMQDAEMDRFTERLIKIVEKESRRKPIAVEAVMNVMPMVSTKA